jgi:hypothetical protein
MSLNRIIPHTRRVVTLLLAAAAFTYCSLAIPGSVFAVCSNVTTPIYCPVLAYGFPIPFLADSQAVSPVGSVARDPLSLIVGLDDLLWAEMGLDGLFWLLISWTGQKTWQRWRQDVRSR